MYGEWVSLGNTDCKVTEPNSVSPRLGVLHAQVVTFITYTGNTKGFCDVLSAQSHPLLCFMVGFFLHKVNRESITLILSLLSFHSFLIPISPLIRFSILGC